MNLKGIDKINKIMNDFLEPFECTANVGTDFEYLYAESLIHYAFVVSEESNEFFIKDVEKRFPQVHADIFLWSTMHELGHSETLDELEDDEVAESKRIKTYIYSHQNSISKEEEYKLYFSCPDEKAATDWAGNYMMGHKDEVSAFWNKLRPALMEFYRLNYIER